MLKSGVRQRGGLTSYSSVKALLRAVSEETVETGLGFFFF